MYVRTVLIVEDEPLIRMLLADALEDEGCAVVEAATALEAIGILGTRDVDVVITDIDMPGGLSGLDLSHHVTSSRAGLPVIVTSGGHLLNSEDLPGNALFIAKPYNLQNVVQMLLELSASAATSGFSSGASSVNRLPPHGGGCCSPFGPALLSIG